MKLLEQNFNLFNREHFLFVKMREHEKDEVESIKDSFKESWQHWKSIMNETYKLLGNDFDKPETESWTNGWSIRSRFWTRLKYKDRSQSSSCIATMINNRNLRVYLEWHNYKSEKSTNKVEQHNMWIDYLDTWVANKNINTNDYRIWTSVETDYEEYITLETFLNDHDVREEYQKLFKETENVWIRVGRVFSKEIVLNWDNAEQEMAKSIIELEEIYDHTQKEDNIKRNYWLFNVYYSKNPLVWEKSKSLEVAAMQYEVNIQQQSAVTRNLNLIKEISVGDYVIAYTGSKGFLALGEVTIEFFNEEDESKFINVNGEDWRQRIGVNWFSILSEPVISSKPDLKNNLGLDPSTVMGSATIFKLPKVGYQFVQQLMSSGEGGGKVTVKSTFADYVRAKGFNFEEMLLKNYILSLKSKPFTIFSGISGTGKTKIAQFFAEYMCPDEDVIIDKFEKENDEFSIKYQIKPYNLKYKQLIIPQKYSLLLDLPDEGTSALIKVVFDGIITECRIYNAENGTYRQLSFKGEVGKHLIESYKNGDYVQISFEKDNDKDVVLFNRINPDKKLIRKKSDRYLFISVRPDWMDNTGLIGYYNPITEQYQVTELLKLMLRAKADKTRPYFVILDEMNLAKVEYYFSDFLSCLESRRISDGELRSESIKLHNLEPITFIDEYGTEYVIPHELEIPENVYFTGTVNIDETTYMFSPKVLDRANVIEFNEIDMDQYLEVLTLPYKSEKEIILDSKFVEAFTDHATYHFKLIKKDFDMDEQLLYQYNHIKDINDLLKGFNMHFGYRVVDEILYYLSNGKEMNYFMLNEGLDLQILQRILPKFHGNRKKLEQPLTEILCYCFGFSTDQIRKGVKFTSTDYLYLEQYYRGELNEDYDSPLKNKVPDFPLTAKKVYRMLANLRTNGFASFIE